MKPKIVELVLPSSNCKALEKELAEIGQTGLLPPYDPYDDEKTHPLMNTQAISVYLGNRVKRHLPKEWIQTLSSIDEKGHAPIILLKDLPTSSASNAFISEYLLRGISQLLGKTAQLKKIRLNIFEDRVGVPDIGIGYHRDGVYEPSLSGKTFGKSSYEYSLILCDRGNKSAATYFVDGKNKNISYRQTIAESDQERLKAQPVVLESGDICIFRNNELLHGRKPRTEIDPRHLRRITSALISLSEEGTPLKIPSKNPPLERMIAVAQKELQARISKSPGKI